MSRITGPPPPSLAPASLYHAGAAPPPSGGPLPEEGHGRGLLAAIDLPLHRGGGRLRAIPRVLHDLGLPPPARQPGRRLARLRGAPLRARRGPGAGCPPRPRRGGAPHA